MQLRSIYGYCVHPRASNPSHTLNMNFLLFKITYTRKIISRTSNLDQQSYENGVLSADKISCKHWKHLRMNIVTVFDVYYDLQVCVLMTVYV